MSFNLKELDFNVELSSSMARGSSFPRDNCSGIELKRPDEKIRKYKLKLWLSKETCEKAKMSPTGFIMVRLSACSNAAQVLYEDKQGEHFKGYRLRPLGAYANDKKIKEKQKEKKSKYMPCYVELSVNFEEVNSKKTRKFSQEYVDNLHVAKGQVVLDISNVALFVNP